MSEDFVGKALDYLTRNKFRWRLYTTTVRGAEIAMTVYRKDLHTMYGSGTSTRAAVENTIKSIRQRRRENVEESDS